MSPPMASRNNSPDQAKRRSFLRSLGDFLFSLNGVTLLLVLALVGYPDWPIALRAGLLAVFLIFHLVPRLKKHASIFCRCLLPILIGAICVEAYVLLNEWGIASSVMRYFIFAEQYNETFYSGIATLYAIITALALVKGIEDFDEMKKNIADEAYKVRSISEMLHYFDIRKQTKMRAAVLKLKRNLLDYARNVADMQDQHIRNENLSILRRCQGHIAELTPEDVNDHNSLGTIMQAHAELGTLRSKRINSVGEKIPRYLIGALWLMALGLILPFMAEPLFIPADGAAGATQLNPMRFGQYYIIFLMAALNSFLLLMLSDISNPFDGFWRVRLEAFDELTETLEAELALEESGERAAAQ